jgi:hypothetical protein
MNKIPINVGKQSMNDWIGSASGTIPSCRIAAPVRFFTALAG